jgi:hypothetical protein
MGSNLLKRLLPLGVIGMKADKLKCKNQEMKEPRKKTGGVFLTPG